MKLGNQHIVNCPPPPRKNPPQYTILSEILCPVLLFIIPNSVIFNFNCNIDPTIYLL